MNIGLQIYTLREIISEGYDTIFQKVAEIGYKGIEMTYSPADGYKVAEALKKHGLVCTGAHVSADALRNDPREAVDFLRTIGSNKIIIPWIGGDAIETEAATIATAKRFEEGARLAVDHGFELSFHNHTIEFERKFGERTIMDIFYDEAPTMKFEIDCGWAVAAGVDIVATLNKFGNRLSVVHIKDVDANNTPTEIGSGRVDMKAALDTAKKYGVTWGVVEQDNCINYPPLESIKVSFDYIKTIN